MFRLKVARTAAEIEELCSAWDRLESAGQSMFQSYLWNQLAARMFAGREEPYFIFAESDSGAAIVPAVIDIQGKTIGLAGERLFDYRDYLSVGDPMPLLRAWAGLAELKLPISITAITHPESFAWNRLPRIPFSAAPQLSNREVTAQEFTRKHSRAFGRLRKLQRMGLHIREYPGTAPMVQEIYRRRAQQSGPEDLFRDPQRAEFMVAACREAGKGCEVFALEHGSTLAAAFITFRDREFRRFYTTYYDPAWARYSPGVSLLFEIARRGLEQGLSVDLMTGEQPYKTRIAPQALELFRVTATARQLQEALADFASKEVAA